MKGHMNRFLSIFIAIAMMITVLNITSFAANSGLTMIGDTVLNDQLLFTVDEAQAIPVGDDGKAVLPITYKGTTYLPLKAIGYMLGLGISYDGPNRTVLITSTTTNEAPKAMTSSKTNKLTPITGAMLNGQLKFKINSESAVPVDGNNTPVLPITYNGTTYLPVRAIGILLEVGIEYDNGTKTVKMTKTVPKQWRLVNSRMTWPTIGGWVDGELTYSYTNSFTASNDVGTTKITFLSVGEKNFRVNSVYSVNNKLITEKEHLYEWTPPQSVLNPKEMIEFTATVTTIMGPSSGAYASANIDKITSYSFSTSGDRSARTLAYPDKGPVVLKYLAPSSTYDNDPKDQGQKFEIGISMSVYNANIIWVYTYEYK